MQLKIKNTYNMIIILNCELVETQGRVQASLKTKLLNKMTKCLGIVQSTMPKKIIQL